MTARLSRRKLADYTATRLREGKGREAIVELAAYLIDTQRTREAELVVRDIEQALADRGIVVAETTSAHALDESLRQQIAQLLGSNVHVRETIDPTVLGGVRIDTPGKRLDATMRRRLNALSAQKL